MPRCRFGGMRLQHITHTHILLYGYARIYTSATSSELEEDYLSAACKHLFTRICVCLCIIFIYIYIYDDAFGRPRKKRLGSRRRCRFFFSYLFIFFSAYTRARSHKHTYIYIYIRYNITSSITRKNTSSSNSENATNVCMYNGKKTHGCEHYTLYVLSSDNPICTEHRQTSPHK